MSNNHYRQWVTGIWHKEIINGTCLPLHELVQLKLVAITGNNSLFTNMGSVYSNTLTLWGTLNCLGEPASDLGERR